MTNHVFLIDVTRHKGPTQSLINSARAYLAKYESAKTEWICGTAQASEFAALGTTSTVSYDEAAMHIEKRVVEMASNGSSGATFHVLSYDGMILRRAVALNGPALVVTAANLASIPRYPATGTLASVTREDASSRFANRPGHDPLPVEVGVQLTKQLLEQGQHGPSNPLLQMKLRGLLEKEDPRAKKNARDLQSASLIKNIVSRGVHEGWLGTTKLNGQAGSEVVWLKALQSPIPTSEPVPEKLEPALQVASIVDGACESGEYRTKTMIKSLKDQGLYSPKDVRNLLVEQIERLIPEKRPVGQLFREASLNAQQSAAAAGVSFDCWYPATQAVMKMMLMAGVLKDETTSPIPPGLSSRGTTVAEIDPAHADKCECLLLEALITGVGDITERDMVSLAHALFKQSPAKVTRDQMMDRLEQVISLTGARIEERPDGVLQIAAS